MAEIIMVNVQTNLSLATHIIFITYFAAKIPFLKTSDLPLPKYLRDYPTFVFLIMD